VRAAAAPGRIDVIDTAALPWSPGETEGLTFRCQVLLDGADGGPEALRFRFDPTPSVYAHMHLTSQFQVLLGGGMDMPRGIELRALDVHYTDHRVPYGPFRVLEGHDMLVLHPKRGGLLATNDLESREAINRGGRLVVGSPSAVEWRQVKGSSLRMKPVLASGDGAVRVTLIECPPGAGIQAGPAEFGRYEVVVAGSVVLDGRSLPPPAIRYVEGPGAPPAPLVAGPQGATLMLLTFDADSRRGGLTDESISIRAEEAMRSAI
jgi:hypothetical protein